MNYFSNLSIDQTVQATDLTFRQFVPPIDGLGEMLTWDYVAFFSTGANHVDFQNIFAFMGTAGATYDIFSKSFFDPYTLLLFDVQGTVIAADDTSGPNGTDHIEFIAPYDGTFYLDASWRQGFTPDSKSASVVVYEDLDTIPPLTTASDPRVIDFSPANAAKDIALDSNIVLTFNEAIQQGAGQIILKTASGIVIETFDPVFSSNLSIHGQTLTINPTNNLANNTQYSVILNSGAIKDLAGNSNPEINSYRFTTIATTFNPIDRIFNWGESHFPDLLPDHVESFDAFGYYARLYANGNAVGEQNGNIYFYDGGANGTGEIILVGTTNDFMSYAISAGF
ncbi:MAG: hypothetical protein DYH15_09350 [Nitrosomonas sp. PRO4]|nr:hypothetical protein [Nitrosomonas sp. PRO4]